MEGATVKDRIKSLESNAQASTSKQLSPRFRLDSSGLILRNRSTNTRAMTLPTKTDPSFAQKGALLSFQKRADNTKEPIRTTEPPLVLPVEFGRQLTTSPESVKGNRRPNATSP